VTSERARWLLLVIAALVLVLHSLAYNFVTDDAYISFVYSRNLAEHGQLAFNLGQHVEGYTNFLWTVLLGGLMVPGIPPELSSRVLGAGCALATLYVVFRVMERALGRKTPWACVPSLLLACSSGFACWTSGGLETQLFTLLCAIGLDAVVAAEAEERALRRAGIALALAAMTRPEGLLVAGALGVTRIVCNLVARRRVLWRAELVALGWLLVIWAPWFAWRWWYYGWPFPNTYYVKASGPWTAPSLAREMWSNGLYYLWTWVRQTGLVYALPIAIVGLVATQARTPRFALSLGCAVLAAVYLPYAASVGGDFMGLHRFIMPMFVLGAIAVVLGLEWLVARLERGRRALAIVLASALVGGFAVTQVLLTAKSLAWKNWDADRGIIDTPSFLIVYTEDRAAIGRAMASCFRDDDFSIVGGAGAQPYNARMRGIDVFGLVSDRIAHEEPRMRARAGHTKFGSDKLLSEYDPTFVFSCYEIHPTPTAPAPACAGFWLARGYELVTMHVPGLQQLGEYYTFLAKKSRDFQCPGRVN
jgi:arabinofuranosyltransferase